MTNLLGCDATNVASMPAGYDVYCGYTTGTYNNYNAVVAAHPGKKYVGISISVAPTDCYDVEPGGGTAALAPAFFKQCPHPNLNKPMFYADNTRMPGLVAALSAAKILRSSYYLWLALWDNNPAIPAGYDGKQFANHPGFDASSFAPNIFRGAVPVIPPPPPTPTYWDYELNYKTATGQSGVQNWQACGKCHGLFNKTGNAGVCPAGGIHTPWPA